MEKVLDIYKQGYDKLHPVVCMDESPKQLIEAKGQIAISPGQERKIDYEYIRHGMVNIFIANEPLRGKRLVKITERKTKKDWASFVKDISYSYCEAEKITLVMDNLGTHTLSAFYEAFSPEEARRLRNRFEFVFTPKHGSWLNMAEIELQVLSRQCLNRHISTKEKVIREVKAWERRRNSIKSTINWQFNTETARIKLKRLYPSYSD
ncbi:MAG: IS630 family transposase [Candidatus Marinimicrobia bacterium CG1_02_48_14]|nr:MAG: IS630 family transposase [Candidatus Marinimicrobia bacterium CG1_02_48_14]